MSWDFDLSSIPNNYTSIELYRNNVNQIGDRTRLLTSDLVTIPQGTVLDDGTLGNNLGAAPLVDGETYWYMFKINLDNNEAVNTPPEAGIPYSQ